MNTDKPSLSNSIKYYWHGYRLLIVILIIAAILRLIAAFYLGNSVSGLSGAHDEISYSMLGQRFAEGYGMTFPSPWYPWIQPDAPQSYYSYTISLFLAFIYKVFGYQPLAARLIMALLSTITVLLIYLVSKRFFTTQTALLAAAIAAVYAYLIFYGVTLVTETPFILFLLISIYSAQKITEGGRLLWWFVFAVALAITVLLRMAIVFFLPFMLLWLFLNLPSRRDWMLLIIPIVVIIFAVLPFTLRNIRLWDHFLLLESQFGHVFWNGNHPGHQGDFHPYEIFPIPPEVLVSQNDAVITNTLLRMGVQNVLNDPADFVSLTLTRLREFFTFWPTADSTPIANLLRIISFGVMIPFMVVGIVINLPQWRKLSILFIFMFIHTGVYSISWTMIRYRIPLDAFLIMFAASAILAMGQTWQRRRYDVETTRKRSPV